MEEVSNKAKLDILLKEIEIYNNTLYLLSVRARSAKLVKNEELLKVIEKDIQDDITILDDLKSQLSELQK